MSRYFSVPEVDAGLNYPRLMDAFGAAEKRCRCGRAIMLVPLQAQVVP